MITTHPRFLNPMSFSMMSLCPRKTRTVVLTKSPRWELSCWLGRHRDLSDLGPQQSLDGRAHQLSQCIGDTVSALQVGWLATAVDGVRWHFGGRRQFFKQKFGQSAIRDLCKTAISPCKRWKRREFAVFFKQKGYKSPRNLTAKSPFLIVFQSHEKGSCGEARGKMVHFFNPFRRSSQRVLKIEDWNPYVHQAAEGNFVLHSGKLT